MTDNQERPFGVTGAALAASIEESAARDPTGVDLWLQALKQPIAQTAAY